MTESQEHLILKYLNGTLSAQEKTAFESWLNESDENRRQLNDLKKVWSIGTGPVMDTDFQKDHEWERLTSSIRKPDVIALNTRSYILKIAAAVSFFLVAASAIYLTVFRDQTIVVQAIRQIEKVKLPDGSEVCLNEGSMMSYSTRFESRELSLDGEAFFDVKRNPEKPFIIHTGEANVEVLGTSFNVKAFEGDVETEVFVVTGRVNFSSSRDSKGIILQPGSGGVLNKKEGTIALDAQDNSNILAWKEKKLVFRKTPLRNVLKTLRSYFKTDINVQDEDLLNCRFTGSFDNPTLEEVVETVRLSLDLQVDHQANMYTFSGEGCNVN